MWAVAGDHGFGPTDIDFGKLTWDHRPATPKLGAMKSCWGEKVACVLLTKSSVMCQLVCTVWHNTHTQDT